MSWGWGEKSEPLQRTQTVNGCEMELDYKGRIIERTGGIWWDMRCRYHESGEYMIYENSLGYKAQWVDNAFLKRKVFTWSTPPNDVFKITLRIKELKDIKKNKQTLYENATGNND